MKVSISQIKLFKSCRKAWYFRYCEKLVPVEKAEALETGKKYHEFLEELEKDPDCNTDDWGYSKEAAMAKAYKKHIAGKFHVISAEKWLEKKLGQHKLVGIVDGLSDDGFIVEHKTTSADIMQSGEYEYNLLWDEQILAYMSLTGSRKVHYTVCKKPTIRLKKDETEEEFHNRILAWYDENTEEKLRVFTVERTDAEVEQFEKDFKAICHEMKLTAKNEKKIYRNTCNCSVWGRRCEYSSICLCYDPEQQYIEFKKKQEVER